MGGSAISQVNKAYWFSSEGWVKTQKGKGVQLWKNKATSQELQEHQFVVDDSREFGAYKEIFELRYHSECLVSSHHINVSQENGLCTNLVRGSVFIEKIVIKLSDINEIPFPDILHFYSQCFQGLGELYSRFGYFQITEDLIGANQSGKVKVWMNSNFNAFRKEISYINPQGTETEMLQKLMQLLDLNTNQEEGESIYLFISNRNPKGFEDAQECLKEYARMHRVRIPACSGCLLAMTEVLKSNSITDLAFNNPFREQSSESKRGIRGTISPGSSVDIRGNKVSRFTLSADSHARAMTPPPVLIRGVGTGQVKSIQVVHPIIHEKPILPRHNAVRQDYFPARVIHQRQANGRQVKQRVSQSPPITQPHSLSIPKLIPARVHQSPPAVIASLNSTKDNDGRNMNYSPSRQIIPKIPQIIGNHQIPIKQSPTILKRPQPQPQPSLITSLPNNQYYSNFIQSKSPKQTATSSNSSLANRFAQLKNSPSKSPYRQPNTSVFKQPSVTMTPIHRINQSSTENQSNKFSFSTPFQTPKQPIIFVNQKQNSSFVVIPESHGGIPSNSIEEEQISNDYGLDYYEMQKDYSKGSSHNLIGNQYLLHNNSDESIKPPFPTPEIINVRQQLSFSFLTPQQPLQQQPQSQPRGGVYVKKRFPSLQYIHSLRSQSSLPHQNVRVSYQSINPTPSNNMYTNNYNYNSYSDLSNLNALRMKETTQSRQAIIETLLSQESKGSKESQLGMGTLERIMESPVELRIRREDYSNQYLDYPYTFSNLTNFQINPQDYTTSIYRGISAGEYGNMNVNGYLDLMDQKLKEDYIEYKIRISGETRGLSDI